MGRCAVTGIETNDKWKGFFICREAREMAKELEKRYPRETMRSKMIHLQRIWKEDAGQAMEKVAAENGEVANAE